ncbi:MAG: integration host factor subunit beta [Treponema sp.]|nr:integration host factor subunit beta [Treponema sp.]
MKKVTKADLVDKIHKSAENDSTDYGIKEIQDIVDMFLKELKGQIIEGGVIELRGFGTFEPKLRNGRKDARNPKTGETHDVAPHFISHFRPGQEIREEVNKIPVK